MVHRMDSVVDDTPELMKSCRKTVMVKSEFEESVDFLYKRRKLDFSDEGDGILMAEYNPLEEPSPLGLKLKKSPSFLDLIQMRLSQERSASLSKTLPRKEKATSAAADKLKASNFPATLLKIGTWEYKSRYEGDLVAKCYFAKHKLVWEVLDGGLKNKIEIQWSDIMAIKANYPDNAPGTLDVVLARQPLFFREINPQPRKHTLWQATSDFTSGQATMHRQHFLQFPQGTLGKHFEKLMQCDPRLRFLSQQPEIVLDTPFFQPVVSVFGDPSYCDNGFEMKTERRSSISGFTDNTVSMSGVSSSDIENLETVGTPAEHNSRGNVSPIPEGEASSKISEAHGLGLLNQIKLPGLRPSMSVGDLVNHIGECISEQMRFNNPNISIDEAQKRNILEEITQYLLSDPQTSPVSTDETSIMSRVNSLCCLLQKEPTGVQNKLENGCLEMSAGDAHDKSQSANRFGESESYTAERLASHESNLSIGIPRKDSFGELLLNLPRIASLPQFLINVPED